MIVICAKSLAGKDVSVESDFLRYYLSRLDKKVILSNEVWEEFTRAFVDEKKSVIIPDTRQTSDSTHMCIFINETNKPVAVPIKLTNNHVHVFTLKDIQKDENPRWYIDSYNSIAKERDMPLIPPQSI